MQDLITITKLSQTMTILSSMVAPVVLILACGSLITTTSQRITNVIERSRFLTDELKALVKTEESEPKDHEVSLLFFLLDKATQRTRMLQRAIITLYLALCVFIATSLSLGIMDVFNTKRPWLPVVLSILGAAMMFYASVLLIRESSLARTALNREMNETLHYFKSNIKMLSKQQKSRWWRRKARKVKK
ncbi:DUF2721 domain-containing protein [Persicitalea jodogahamensis]|uniref:DUF2721 domain-containing protein n=1 Tax=Persicitalea jodogahamensis TaxID=402147 RepID=A0A8J3GAB2_9BACT|nr:DUF2721 domain-containing protein [Persicitalea jodogahamensis]GHB72835.1 hypothetical protein GCM10007390_28670 [Persicitalea jodogahamensis]